MTVCFLPVSAIQRTVGPEITGSLETYYEEQSYNLKHYTLRATKLMRSTTAERFTFSHYQNIQTRTKTHVYSEL